MTSPALGLSGVTRAAAFPAELACDVLAADGRVMHIRPIRPDDAPALVKFHDGLLPETVYRRFFTAHPHLSDREVERFTQVDYHDRLALVAEREGHLVAVARYDRLPGTADAEVAFVVRDAEQGHGVGTLLLEHLAAAAARRGIDRFTAETLATNATMQAVFRNAGFTTEQRFEDGVVKVTFPIEARTSFVEVVQGRSHSAERRSIEPILCPRAVAVVANGPVATTLVRRIVEGGFTGQVHAVSRLGRARLADLPAPIDLVIVDVPADEIVELVGEAADRGAWGIVVMSAGFDEAGPAGGGAERRLVAAAHNRGLRVVGPNSIGLVNTDPVVSLNATLAPLPEAGHVALLSQTGAAGVVGLAHAARSGMGVSSFVSVGNNGDVSTNDLLEYWEDDPATQVICLDLASIGNPGRLGRLARRVSRTKPIIARVEGWTGDGEGPHAAPAGAMTVDGLLTAAGVIRVRTLTEMFDAAVLLASPPRPFGPRVAAAPDVHVPGFLSPERAALALAHVASYSSWRNLPAGLELLGIDRPAAAGVAGSEVATAPEPWVRRLP